MVTKRGREVIDSQPSADQLAAEVRDYLAAVKRKQCRLARRPRESVE